VFLFDSAVGEDVQVEDTSGTVNVCGVQVTDDIQVEDSGRDILVGDTLGGCGGNTVGDDLEVNRNSGPVEKFVQDNTGGDELECERNEDPFTASGNTGFREIEDQCVEPPAI